MRDFLAIRSFIVVLLLSLQLAACFPMGMPEYVAGAGKVQEVLPRLSFRTPASGGGPKALLLTDDLESLPYGDDSRLGFQFLLGVFPFTHLYFQRGADNLLREVLIDQVRNAGFTVFLSPREFAETIASAISPQIILDAQFKNLSLNAYDAFFFRIISLQGDAELRSFSLTKAGVLEPNLVFPLEISSRHYKSSAHAPELSSLLEMETKDVLQTSLHRLVSRRAMLRGGKVSKPETKKPLVLIKAPNVSTWTASSLGQDLIASYGFPSLPPYSSAAISRILQRGIARGLQSEGIPYYMEASGEESRVARSPAWEIHTSVIDVKREENLTLRASVSLRDARRRPALLIEKQVCELTGVVLPDEDGYLVAALENGVEQLVMQSLGFALREGFTQGAHLECRG